MALETIRRIIPHGLLERRTVSSAAVGLDFEPGATKARISVETAGIRWRDDGTDPTGSVGTKVDAGADPFLYEGDLSAFKMIRSSGIDAITQALFYNNGGPNTNWNILADLVAHYKLNENELNTQILDASGNAFNGVVEGGKNTRDLSVAGLVSTGKAFDFDGAADCGNINNVLTSALLASTTGTLACAIEPDDVTQDFQGLIVFGDASQDTIVSLSIPAADGAIRGFCRRQGIPQWDFSTVDVHLVNGVKTWIALVHDGITPKLFVNGVEITDVSFIFDTDKTCWFSNLPEIDSARIGCSHFGTGVNRDFYNGSIDDVRIIIRPLTRLEIVAIWNNNLGSEATSGIFP